MTTSPGGPRAESGYPAHFESDVALKDGSTVRVRPVRAEDQAALFSFLRSLSEDSKALRFFRPVNESFLEAEARREAQVDYKDIFGLVAVAGPGERIVAHTMYCLLPGGRAEAAFAVADDYQGRGLGTILLGHLTEAAAERGVLVLEAEVLPHNHKMVEVFRESGFPVEVRSEQGEVHAVFPTKLTDEALQHFEDRERVASVNALKAFLEPPSVAVIGASRDRGSIGGAIFHNLVTYGFAGPVYPVNPKASVVQSAPAYTSVEAIPGEVGLAIIAVPAGQVPAVVEQCARKKVRAIVAITAGFSEIGGEGRKRQADLLAACRAAGMRLIGPNCMGIVNTDPAVLLDATFAPGAPPAGGIAFSSQSGALGLAIIEQASHLGLGISSFISVGNKADISGNDLLNYWESDPRTDVILLYLESFGNPRKFSRIARRVARRKPVVVVKSGRSKAGARATSSHTGALLASSDVTVDALFRQAGVIRTDTLEELFDVASLLANQPPPLGRRVAIVTNAGGPGIMCADACEAEGLEIPLLGDASQAALRAFLPAQASVSNPVDMIAAASGDDYRRTIATVAADPAVDALIVIFIPPLATRAQEVAEAIVEGVRGIQGSKTLLTVFMSSHGVPEALRRGEVRVPSYAFPESAARALSRAAAYGAWRGRPLSPVPTFADLRKVQAASLVSRALARGPGWLEPAEVHTLLSCYGLPVGPQRIGLDPDQAARAAEELGGAVALKAIVPGLVHKTEAGAVQLGLRGAEAVRAAARDMASRVSSEGQSVAGFLVQPMAPKGVEMIVGVVHDAQFGPVVACGAGGVLVELLGDVSVRLTPLTTSDATEMVRSLKTFPLLTGFRGRPPCDVAALESTLLRVSAMVDDLPQIAELDCNPIVVHEGGATIVDARVRLEPSAPAPPLSARRR